MAVYTTSSPKETEEVGEIVAKSLHAGSVIALQGGLGAGKTAFVRGLAKGLGLSAEVSSPTFAIVHEYGGMPSLVHFDMYRVTGWEDLYSTGYFDYLDAGAILAVEWSENIEAALPQQVIRVTITTVGDMNRTIEVETPQTWHNMYND